MTHTITQNVFSLAADGKNPKSIAEELNITPQEVSGRLNIFNTGSGMRSVNENVKPGKLFEKLPPSLIEAFQSKGVTARQGEVLYLVAQGWSNKNIANFLEISIRTEERHRFLGQCKIGVRNTAGTFNFVMKAAPSLIDASRHAEYEL
jgi:DNA-binding NarL/FixJ family response regulator